jgi:UDP-N-acetylglucosamine--N-acetylmuramyl-(pentapeptide) pyrophosphoryl-undecaprenol N-acetylglucosamine transferase
MSAPVLIMAGGTGGHIFPGLAVAQSLRDRDVPVAWLGATGAMETRLVPAAGIELHTLAIGGLRGKSMLTRMAAPVRLVRALVTALRLFGRLKPRVVIGFGGFAAGPGGVAAVLRRVPLIVHEQNRVAGFTNRQLARFAQRVLGGFPDVLPGAEWVGNPVRDKIAGLPSPAERFASRKDSPRRLLVLGGSLGAKALNQAMPAAIALMPADARPIVRHQSGRDQDSDTLARYRENGIDARVEPFIADMADAYAWADLVICRAGALTLAELAAVGVPSLLVPYPHAVDDHQTRNAEFLVKRGAAELVAQSSLAAPALAARIQALLGDRGRLLAMAEAARACARPDAARDVADICLEIAR